jgi:NADPH-dependent ferric siderophore reductase
MNQRMNYLPFTANGSTLTITAPANANLSPPGHYMLFVVDANGVPSIAKIIRIS